MFREISRRILVSLKDFDRKDSHILNLKNGLLNWKKMEFRKHSPEYLSFRQIPIIYDPKATCPNILKFLKRILPDAIDRRTIFKIFGLCLTPITNFQKFFWFYGKGNNGKTTLLNLLTNLIGIDNRSSIDPHEFKKKSHLLPDIENKLVNIVSDINIKYKIPIQLFKEYIGDEIIITVNPKYIKPYKITPTAKLIFSCNKTFPSVPEETDMGFWRKIIILHFSQVITQEERDREMLKKLNTPEELSGLFNTVLLHLKYLDKKNRFLIRYSDDNWEKIKTFWLTNSNLLEKYLTEAINIERGKNKIADKDRTLKEVNKWLKSQGHPPLKSKRTLTMMFSGTENVEHCRKRINGKQIYVYAGFSYKDDIIESTLQQGKKLKGIEARLFKKF